MKDESNNRRESATTLKQSNASSASWNPYLVGAGIGVLSWLAFAVVNQPIGVSTALSAASGACATPVLGAEAVAQNPYWAKHSFKWDYGMLFLVGIFLGSLLSALASRSFHVETVPQVWAERFGTAPTKRLLAAFAGGALVLYGARMAGGCTSGHGVSGSLQLAVSSWIFFVTLFGAGILTAALLFHKRSKAAASNRKETL